MEEDIESLRNTNRRLMNEKSKDEEVKLEQLSGLRVRIDEAESSKA